MPTPSTALMKGTKVVPDPSLVTLTSKSGSPILVACGDGSTVLIANTDLINTAYIGYQSNLTPAGSNVTAIGPLGTVVMDSSRDIYGVASPAVIVQLIPGGTAWSPPPASIAASISALGLAKDTSVNAPSYGPVPLSYGPAKDSTVSTVNTTLGTPAQHSDVLGVTTAVNAPTFGPAKDSSLTTINGTLGTPAQKSDVNAVNTTLGTPAQHADVVTTLPANVATTGVPLLVKAGSLANAGSTIGAAATVTPTGFPATFNQLGYDISIGLSVPNTSTQPWVSVTLTWTSSVSGAIVAKEIWYLACGSAATQTYIGSGPTKGDTVTISLKNFDGINSVTYSILMTQNSRHYVRDDWRQVTNVAIPTMTAPNVDQMANLLATTSPALAANASQTRSIPLYAGDVSIAITNGAQALTIAIGPVADNQFSPPPNIAIYTPAANATSVQKLSLPRSVCQMVLTNSAGGANAPTVSLTISEALA